LATRQYHDRMDAVRLLARVPLPVARQLINGQWTAHHHGEKAIVGIVVDGYYVVYRLDALLSGDLRPAARFPVPEDSFTHCGMVTADLANAVFPMQGARSGVLAVDQAGAVRWQWRYTYSEGAVLTTTDGRYVWTVIAEGDNGIVTGPVRVAVLDAVDG